MLKRFCMVLLALLMLCACQAKEPDFTETVMVSNPFTTHETLSEAETAADITLTLPSELSECPNVTYRSANSDTLQLIEVIYELNEGKVCVRKGISDDDISGVYVDYPVEAEYDADDLSFSLKGDGKKDYLATWTLDGYAYSIYAEQGMDSAALQNWVYAVK